MKIPQLKLSLTLFVIISFNLFSQNSNTLDISCKVGDFDIGDTKHGSIILTINSARL